MPPNSPFSQYKQHIRNYLYNKYRWDRAVANIWLKANSELIRELLATEVHYRDAAKKFDNMRKEYINDER
jgi:hypothetical protein